MPEPRPFISDGCSGGMSWAWRRLTGHPPPWEGLCVVHDLAYHPGGAPERRLAADLALRAAVAARGHRLIALLMYFAVRLGGHPVWPLPWRWGYGWPYGHGLGRYLCRGGWFALGLALAPVLFIALLLFT